MNPALTQPPVVYIEGYAGTLYLDKPTEIEVYRQALSDIAAVALDEAESRALLEKIEQEYRASVPKRHPRSGSKAAEAATAESAWR